MVHGLGQNRAEGHGGQSAGLLPHSSDLQQGSKGCVEDRVVRLSGGQTRSTRRWKVSLTQPADGTVVGLVAQRVGARVAEAQVPAGQDEGVAQVRQTHHALVAVVAVLVV